MIAETTLISCNHVAPVATANDLDTVSVISADRSSTDSVGACNGHVLAGSFTARACREHALTEGFVHVHDSNELDVDHVERNAGVVKVNGNVHYEHAPDLNVVNYDVAAKSSTACLIPKSKSSSALRSGSNIYSVVKKDKTGKFDEGDGGSYKNTGNKNSSFDDNMDEFKGAKKSKSDAEVAQFTISEYGDQTETNTMHDIRSPSLRNLLQSFMGKIDRLSPKNEGDGYEFAFDKAINDKVVHTDDTELAELAPLLVDPYNSGLASTPSPLTKLQQETPAGSGNVFCLSCGQKQSDMSDISLESFDRASSLRSYNSSLRSDRMKSLSRNSGPVIQIVPEGTAFKENQTMSLSDGKTAKPLEKLFQTGLPNIPKQTVITSHNGTSKIGYVAFSSIDTETSSVAPSTSVSNGSLDSAADMTSDQSTMETNPKSQDQFSDRSRNVAIDSLRNAKHGKSLKDMSAEIEDSGLGTSVGFETNDEYFKTLESGINGKYYTDDERTDYDMQNGSHYIESHEPLTEKTFTDTLGANPILKPKRAGVLQSPNGKEINSLIAPSAFLSGDIWTKRQALHQSHGSGKLDMSDWNFLGNLNLVMRKPVFSGLRPGT